MPYLSFLLKDPRTLVRIEAYFIELVYLEESTLRYFLKAKVQRLDSPKGTVF